MPSSCYRLCRPPESGCCLSNLRVQNKQQPNALALVHAVIKVSIPMCAYCCEVCCPSSLLQGLVAHESPASRVAADCHCGTVFVIPHDCQNPCHPCIGAWERQQLQTWLRQSGHMR